MITQYKEGELGPGGFPLYGGKPINNTTPSMEYEVILIMFNNNLPYRSADQLNYT